MSLEEARVIKQVCRTVMREGPLRVSAVMRIAKASYSDVKSAQSAGYLQSDAMPVPYLTITRKGIELVEDH